MREVLHEAQVRSLKRMSEAERMALNARLWDHARALKEAVLRSQHGDWSEDRVRQAAKDALQNASG